MSSEISFEKRGAVFVITFTRADNGNAFNGFMAKALSDKLKPVLDDRAIRAVLICGQGAHFMNGHDMTGYTGDMNAIQDQVLQKVQFFYTSIRDLQGMDKPVICAVHGRVSGAGFNFMLASDLVIAATDTVFNTGFVHYAMMPDGGVTSMLPRKIGMARATELLLLGEDFTVIQAQQYGLVTRVAEPAALQADALAWAQQIADGPTRMLGATKRLISKSFEQDLNAQISLEANFWNVGSKTFDFREAMKAFAAKRPAKFTGS